jgi:FG-GAP-like repeat
MTDLDNDGIADVIWDGRHFLWVFRGTGDGQFKYMNKEWGIKDLSAASVDDGHCFGDINGDGMPRGSPFWDGRNGVVRYLKVRHQPVLDKKKKGQVPQRPPWRRYTDRKLETT